MPCSIAATLGDSVEPLYLREGVLLTVKNTSPGNNAYTPAEAASREVERG